MFKLTPYRVCDFLCQCQLCLCDLITKNIIFLWSSFQFYLCSSLIRIHKVSDHRIDDMIKKKKKVITNPANDEHDSTSKSLQLFTVTFIGEYANPNFY